MEVGEKNCWPFHDDGFLEVFSTQQIECTSITFKAKVDIKFKS